jgi:hypothetical protein
MRAFDELDGLPLALVVRVSPPSLTFRAAATTDCGRRAAKRAGASIFGGQLEPWPAADGVLVSAAPCGPCRLRLLDASTQARRSVRP